jgi:hypothetical protein
LREKKKKVNIANLLLELTMDYAESLLCLNIPNLSKHLYQGNYYEYVHDASVSCDGGDDAFL